MEGMTLDPTVTSQIGTAVGLASEVAGVKFPTPIPLLNLLIRIWFRNFFKLEIPIPVSLRIREQFFTNF